MPTPDKTVCPNPECGGVGLVVEELLEARPLGTYSVAGAQLKVAARAMLRWRCETCGNSGPAEAS